VHCSACMCVALHALCIAQQTTTTCECTSSRSQGCWMQAVPSTVLQQFAWAQGDVARRIHRRNSQIAQLCHLAPSLADEPMFCVEHAIKCFFWSALAYDYTEAEGATFQRLPEAIRELMGEVDAAMQLFDLSKRHMFYDRQRGTKVVVAWSADIILLTVRGSVERANFIQDAKVWHLIDFTLFALIEELTTVCLQS
jgi:hypothetical protein